MIYTKVKVELGIVQIITAFGLVTSEGIPRPTERLKPFGQGTPPRVSENIEVEITAEDSNIIIEELQILGHLGRYLAEQDEESEKLKIH